MPDDYHHLIGYMREHGIAAWHRHPLTWEGDIAEANDDAARDEAYSQLEETAGKQEHCHADYQGPCLADDCPLPSGRVRVCPGVPGPQHPATRD